MEYIEILNVLDNKYKYLITSNSEDTGKITIEKNEKLRIIINNLNNISSNDLNNFNIKSLEFVSTSLIKSFDIEKINNLLSNLTIPISKIKFLGYFVRYDNLEKTSLPYLQISTLSIKNLIYPNFNIFELFNNIELETFKLDNYKFSSNEELRIFFDFIKRKNIKNLILNNIFIEILENNNNNLNECNYEIGILKTYFEFNGNSISLIINDNKETCEIKSLIVNYYILILMNFQ